MIYSLSPSAMSVEVLISPRISFSHDLRETEHESSVPIEAYPYSSPSLDTGFDFDFAFIVDSHGALIRESSTADELFSDGKLLPNSVHFTPTKEITPSLSPVFPCFETEEKGIVTRLMKSSGDYSTSPVFPCFETEDKKKILKSLKEYLQDSIDIEEVGGGESESPPAQAVYQSSAIRTFWKFGRSNSLNSSNYGRSKAKLNIPSKLRLLARSKSTGFGVVSLSAKPVKEEETKPEELAMAAGRSSFWKVRRSNSLDCDKSYQNRGGLIESLKIILSRSNSSGDVLANRKMENANELDKEKQFGIRRSCSLNCNRHNRRRGLIMGRSNSTGSASNLKQTGINNGKEELQKQSSGKYPSCNAAKATALKKEKGQGRRSFKDYYGSCSKSERVNSVLNLPSPYISRISVDFLGFGSLFCSSSKSRKVKR